MAHRICSIDGCDRRVLAYGWCQMHHGRWRRTGSPLGKVVPSPAERFWAKVDKSDTCWLWTASTGGGGYGKIQWGGHLAQAHRVSYELLVGLIPDGLFLDHICHNRRCVNPDHLRPVTHGQNMQNRSPDQRNNTSGYRGVSFDKATGRWFAQVGLDGQHVHLGRFPTAEEACAAAVAGRLQLHTHNVLDRQSK